MWFLSCSGPGARAAIAGNEAFARGLAIIAGVLVVTSLRIWWHDPGRRFPSTSLLLFGFHPAWTIGARSGDCGTHLTLYASVVTLVLLLIVGIQAGRFFANPARIKPQKHMDDLE